MNHARRLGNFGRAAAITLMIVSGCFHQPAGPPVHPTASAALPDPAGAVFANCRELVCTHAEVPPCDFDQVVSGSGPDAVVDRVQCVRAADGTDCEERRAPGGAGDLDTRTQVLKFRCSGDPVECRMTGGTASWETTLDPAEQGGRSLRYPCQRARPGPVPDKNPVPGPNTV